MVRTSRVRKYSGTKGTSTVEDHRPPSYFHLASSFPTDADASTWSSEECPGQTPMRAQIYRRSRTLSSGKCQGQTPMRARHEKRELRSACWVVPKKNPHNFTENAEVSTLWQPDLLLGERAATRHLSTHLHPPKVPEIFEDRGRDNKPGQLER